MKVTKGTHLQATFQNSLFTVLLIIVVGLIAWLSERYEVKTDWTVNNLHSLSKASKSLLDTMQEPIKITAYASKDNNLRNDIQDIVERYQWHKKDISLHFVDPFTVPGEVRERGVQADGELIIDYQGRSEHLRQSPLSEQDLTSALQRVARTDNRLIVFLEGHGERSVNNGTDYDLDQWALALKNIGFKVESLNLGEGTGIPDNTNVLVIATPQNKLFPGEVSMIIEYLEHKRGNILWLLDPSVSLAGLEPLAKIAGLTVQPGMIVDPTSQLFGNSPAVVSITTSGYHPHPITLGLENQLTLFPQASGLLVVPPKDENWLEDPLLTTNPQAWSETGESEGIVQYDEGVDINGPLNIAYALVREEDHNHNHKKESETEKSETDTSEADAEDLEDTDDLDNKEQRMIIFGESDFLSNAYIGYGANMELGDKMMNWLAEDDDFIDIPSKTAVDLSLDLSPNEQIFLGSLFLFLLPIFLVGIGIMVFLLRRRKA
jgi:ABC-type uncharacterized transport system involved in gliding motility auxiliary subunit